MKVPVAVNPRLPFTCIVSLLGVTVIEVIVAGETVSGTDEDCNPSVAEMLVEPAVSPFANPVCCPIEATLVLPELQLSCGKPVTLRVAPFWKVAMALNC